MKMKNTGLRSKIAAVVLCAFLGGCATADRGQTADIITTSMAFDRGFVEGNPLLDNLSIGQIAAIKLGLTQAVKFAPEPVCTPGLFGLTAVGYGAALWNIGVMAGSGPAAIPVIIGLTWWQWDDWIQSSYRTCKDPWHFEPITFIPSNFNDQ